MDIWQIPGMVSERLDELILLVALISCTLFYKEYKRQLTEMEHEEMLDRFLNDWSALLSLANQGLHGYMHIVGAELRGDTFLQSFR